MAMLAGNMRAWRLERGWTQAHLAVQLNVMQPLVSKWERGAAPIPAKIEAKIGTLSGPPQPAPVTPTAASPVTWHRQDGAPIDQAPADEIVRNTVGGQLPAAIARELLASHAQGRAPNYAKAQQEIEAAQAARLKPAPIPYEAWRAASGVLNLPSRRG